MADQAILVEIDVFGRRRRQQQQQSLSKEMECRQIKPNDLIDKMAIVR